MSGMAHFFVVVSGSKIHERVAHFFIDIYRNTLKRTVYFMRMIRYFDNFTNFQGGFHNMKNIPKWLKKGTLFGCIFGLFYGELFVAALIVVNHIVPLANPVTFKTLVIAMIFCCLIGIIFGAIMGGVMEAIEAEKDSKD